MADNDETSEGPIPQLPPIHPVDLSFRERPLSIMVFALLAILILWGAWKIIVPFGPPILLALVIVTFSHPMYQRLTVRLGGRKNLAALLMVLGIVLVIVIPAVVLGIMLVQQAAQLVKTLDAAELRAYFDPGRFGASLGWISRYVPGFDPSRIQLDEMLVNGARQISGWVATRGSALFAGAANLLFGFVMMLLASFYFYVEGARLARELRYLSPLPDEYDQQLFAKFRGVIDATFRGQILTAIAQGFVTGIGLAICGINGAIFWGGIAAVLAIIPMVGAGIVWFPAAIYLLLRAYHTGESFGWGIFLLIWGFVVVSLVDNVIRPWAMKAGLDMNAIVLFFAILGGLSAFGLSGLILGPLVFALLVTVIDMYRSFFAHSLEAQNIEPQ